MEMTSTPHKAKNDRELQMVHTAAALIEFDRTYPQRDLLLTDALTDADVAVWEKAETDALRKVQEAFYQDTSDRNSLDTCHRMQDIAWLRMLVEKYPGAVTPVPPSAR